jgi:NADH-quinone oxidoreductase subunit G
MGSVGACRLCAVKQYKDEEDTQGKIVMSCMTPVSDGLRLSLNDPEARLFRKTVLEWLMVNHPHDCPICDEGGECHLQDMTVMTGHSYREYRFQKRTYRNQYLGPLINHEMNRCIQCYRCVRFYRDHAGGGDLRDFAIHDHVYFGRETDGVLESEFSGNLVEVCPTGVFTDKSLKQHYTRKWDLQTAPSICVHCGVGCNTIPGERYGALRRIRNRYNSEVNRYFLCDRGRYGYEFVNSEQRIRQPLLRNADHGALEPATPTAAVQQVAALLANSAGVIGIGSPRASLEANFALRELVGAEHFTTGVQPQQAELIAAMLDVMQRGPARSPSLHEVEQADAVLVLGEDISNTAPMIALAVRQTVRQQPIQHAAKLGIPAWQAAAVQDATQHQQGPLFVATPAATRLDHPIATTYRAAPDDIARLGFAVAHLLDAAAPAVPDLPDDVRALAEQIAQALRAAERPLVVSGGSLGSAAIIQAAANIAGALCSDERRASLCFALPECNSLGAALLGGGSLAAAHEAVQRGEADTLVILENDLYRQAERATVEALLEQARHVVVIDHLHHATAARADVVLPAATFAEGDGTLVNNEGRAQRFYQVMSPQDAIQESWRWLREILAASGRAAAPWHTLDEIGAALAEALPVFRPITDIAPPADFRVAGGLRIPRQPHRYSGRTAMHAHHDVREPRPPDDPDAPLAFSMEGYRGQPPAALIPEFWAPGWNSNQSVNKFQSEVGGPLHGGDPGRRLLEPPDGARAAYFDTIPAAFQPRQDAWLLVPLYHVFGSEELSMHAPAIAELAPAPMLRLNPADAERLHLAAGQEAAVSLGEQTYRAPVALAEELPPGTVGVPVGLPGAPAAALPAWAPLASTAAEGAE